MQMQTLSLEIYHDAKLIIVSSFFIYWLTLENK